MTPGLSSGDAWPGAHSSSPALPTCQLPPVLPAARLTWPLRCGQRDDQTQLLRGKEQAEGAGPGWAACWGTLAAAHVDRLSI